MSCFFQTEKRDGACYGGGRIHMLAEDVRNITCKDITKQTAADSEKKLTEINAQLEEVKALAAQTVSSTTKIQELVKKNNLSTKQAKDVISSTNRAIKTITALSESIKTSISEQVNSSADISNRLQDASTGIEQITAAITEIASLGLKLK